MILGRLTLIAAMEAKIDMINDGPLTDCPSNWESAPMFAGHFDHWIFVGLVHET